MPVKVSRLVRTGFHLRTKVQGGVAAKPLPADVTFTTFGTSPVANAVEGGEGGVLLVDVTSGSGANTPAVNNIIITFSQAPVAAWLRRNDSGTLRWDCSVSGSTVRIGGAGTIAASTNYKFELLVEF